MPLKTHPMPHIGPGAQRVEVRSADGVSAELICLSAPSPNAAVVWLPALGVPARVYLGLAQQLTQAGVSVALHEWRGIGSSSVRASRQCDWGYAELLQLDLVATESTAREVFGPLRFAWGGHSLGGQLAAMHMAASPGAGEGLALIGSGAPLWHIQRRRMALALLGARVAAPMLTGAMGYLPGRQIGFGGRESRGVMRDWLRSVSTGEYRPQGIDIDMEASLRQVRVPVFGALLAEDLYAPPAALDYLVGKLSPSTCDIVTLDRDVLGVRADHFSWLKRPDAVAADLANWVGRLAAEA